MDKKTSLRDVLVNEPAWILVPVISFGGILISLITGGWTVFLTAGAWGCVFASFFLAYLAYRKPRKDIVSLLTPLYAVLIFGNMDFSGVMLTQVLYAASLTILVIRLNARFSHVEKRHKMTTLAEEEPEDEQVPD
ncbi:MAG: hypothetical protein LUQ17_00675 [Methanomicrobiales archaeon]|nr:hypothetical protein [Methanomicrobiales archaeon]